MVTDQVIGVIVPTTPHPPTGRSLLPQKNENKMKTTSGAPSPLGAACQTGGVNFSVYSPDAIGMDLLLFDQADDSEPAQCLVLDPSINRTAAYWHLFVIGRAHV